MQNWDPVTKGKALRLKGRSAVAVCWEDAAGFQHVELESGCHLTTELAATVLKVRWLQQLVQPPPQLTHGRRSLAQQRNMTDTHGPFHSLLLQGLLGSLGDTDASKTTPTTCTEALTLRWPALMPALKWRLQQPAGLLPSLRSLDLSHNNLKGERAATSRFIQRQRCQRRLLQRVSFPAGLMQLVCLFADHSSGWMCRIYRGVPAEP
jgi:hypothetical protein